MNNKLLFFALAIVSLGSCTTLYKSGQTPDDVYYSPVRAMEETRNETRREDRNDRRNEDVSYNNDMWQIRMGINNRRWRNFDNDIFYNPYMYGYNYGYYYNPFYNSLPVYYPVPVLVGNPKTTTPRITNLNGYNNGYTNNNSTYNPKTGTRVTSPVRSYNNNNGSKLGNVLRAIISPDAPVYNNNNSRSNNNTNNNNQPSRSYTPSSGSSRSSSSGGSISRPPRSGNNN